MKKKKILLNSALIAVLGISSFNIINMYNNTETNVKTYNLSYQTGANQLAMNSDDSNYGIMPLSTSTSFKNRKEITDSTMLEKITALLREEYGQKKEEYAKYDNVDTPIRLFAAMEFNTSSNDKAVKASISNSSVASKVVAPSYIAFYKLKGNELEPVIGKDNNNILLKIEQKDLTEEGHISNKGYSMTFTAKSQLNSSDTYVAVFFTYEVGYVGYNLVLTGNDRVSFNEENACYYKNSKAGSEMFIDKSQVYYSGETYNITSVIPEDKEGEYTFIAWFDKQEDDYSARVVESGTTAAHYFNRNAGSIQTLDAIWGRYNISKDLTEYYNGKTHEQTADFEFFYNGDDYKKQIESVVIPEETKITWYEKDKMLDNAPKNVGTYKENFSKTFKNINGNVVSTDSTVTIKKRNVTISSENLVKVYDGTPLKASEKTDTLNLGANMNETATPDDGNGWVSGEGIDPNTINFTGSQTEIGTSLNKFTYKGNENTELSNYNIAKEFGTLEVKPRYQIEYYYDGVKAKDKTILHNMKNSTVYFEVGDVVKILDDEFSNSIQYNDKNYKLGKIDNKNLTLTNVDKDNIIKVYYVSSILINPQTGDNILIYIGTLFISLVGFVSGILYFKRKKIVKNS